MTRVVYLSRGHGYGHAAVDLEIVRGLRRRGAEVELASYGTGLAYFATRSEPCHDLGIDDVDDQGTDAALRVTAFLRARGAEGPEPIRVVAHEIFTAPSVCRALGVRNTLLTHWFFSEVGVPALDARLGPADSLLLLDFEAAHRVPDDLVSRVSFTGAIARPIGLDRDGARRRLGVGGERTIVVATGASTPVNAAHLTAVVQGAVRALRRTDARILVLSSVRPSDEPIEQVEWVPWTDEPEVYYRAADVVVANATFSTLCTLAGNGVPTVAVTGGRNPVDRLHADFFAAQGLLTTVDVGDLPAGLSPAVDAEVPAGRTGRDLDWATPDGVAAQLAAA